MKEADPSQKERKKTTFDLKDESEDYHTHNKKEESLLTHLTVMRNTIPVETISEPHITLHITHNVHACTHACTGAGQPDGLIESLLIGSGTSKQLPAQEHGFVK